MSGIWLLKFVTGFTQTRNKNLNVLSRPTHRFARHFPSIVQPFGFPDVIAKLAKA